MPYGMFKYFSVILRRQKNNIVIFKLINLIYEDNLISHCNWEWKCGEKKQRHEKKSIEL